jgi:hypothetical protein
LHTTWFIIMHAQGQWWVDHEGKAYGPFLTREDALDSAPRLAGILAERDWEVFIVENGVHTVIASGRAGQKGDSVPARGVS